MPKKLLLADDSITIQKVVGITFAQEDFDITYVDNGADAITKAQSNKPDIILADIVMPQKNGYDVCEAVKKNADLKHIPVLLLAGTFETFDVNRGKLVGADDYIIKPFESQALIDKVNGLLQGKTAGTPAPATVAPAVTATPAPKAPPAPVVAQPAPPPPPPPPAEPASFALDSSAMFGDSPVASSKDDFAFDTSGAFDLGADEPTVSTTPPADNSPMQVASAADMMMEHLTPNAIPADGLELDEPTISQPGMEFGLDTSLDLGSVGGAPAAEASEPFVGGESDLDLPPLPESGDTLTDYGAMNLDGLGDLGDAGAAATAAPAAYLPPTINEADVKKLVEAQVQEVLERVAWEILPELAERLIKEEIARLTSAVGTAAPKA